MIYFLNGTVHSFGVDYLILDVNGVGYKISFMHQSRITLNQQLRVYTYQQFREDAQVLYGFLDEKELELFEKLISVKGLGPKTAMTMLGYSNYQDIIRAIENGDVDLLKRIPSLGVKTSKQIILDLKGKLVAEEEYTNRESDELREAVQGLKNLGYKNAEINGIMPALKKFENLSADEYLREALKLLVIARGI